MRILGFLLMASTLPVTCEEEASFKLPEFWHTIIPSTRVETSYLRIALEPRRSAVFRDLGTLTMQQSPHHGHWKIDSSSTSWSSDCQIYEFFQQSQIALETLNFNF